MYQFGNEILNHNKNPAGEKTRTEGGGDVAEAKFQKLKNEKARKLYVDDAKAYKNGQSPNIGLVNSHPYCRHNRHCCHAYYLNRVVKRFVAI